METPTPLADDWLGLIEPARGESCPSGQRPGPAAPGDDRVPSPDQKSFHDISTTYNSTTRGRKRRCPESIPPRAVWKPQPHWLIDIWLGSWSQHAARVAPWANVEVPPHPGRIWSHPRIRISSKSLRIQQPGDVKIPRVDNAPHGVKPQPQWLISD